MPSIVKKSTLKAPNGATCRSDLLVGTQMPSFSLFATQRGLVKSSELRGQAFILYFYPKDGTSGCTAQACAFNEALPNFKKMSVLVFGVSKDTIRAHEKFAAKYALQFPLLSDPEGILCERLDVWKQRSMYGRSYMGIERSTFLVDAAGTIRLVWRKLSVPGHVDEVRQALRAL